MKQLIAFALLLTFALPLAGHAALPDRVPPNDPAWQEADVIQKAGIVMGDPTSGYTGGRVLVTRHNIADAIAKLMRQVGDDPTIAARLTASPAAIAALNALVTEFTPELISTKQNVVQYKSTLAALTESAGHPLVDHLFFDVPLDHWAASAVETLRRDGIVAGYPAGTYRAAP